MSEKYPRTFHLPWSPGATRDDKISKEPEFLLNKDIVITEKIDGSNVCFEREAIYARSHNGAPRHPSFEYAKALFYRFASSIREDQQVFGEYIYAVHSIAYDKVPAYFVLFGVREDEHGTFGANAKRVWLSWEHVEYFAKELSKTSVWHVPTVPVLWKGQVSSIEELQKLTNELSGQPSCYGGQREGLVVRVASGFANEDFSKCVQKWVREDHVQTDEHWTAQQVKRQNIK